MPSIRTQRRWCGSSCIPFKPVLMESCCFQIINSQQHKKKQKKKQSKKLVWKPAIIFLRKKVVWKTNEHRGLADVCDATVFTRQKPISDKRRRLLALPLGSFVFYTCVLISTCFYVSCIWWFSSLTDVSAFHVWEHWEGLSPVMRLIRRGW